MSSYDLSHLTPAEFEHLVNSLSIALLGPGLSTFGPGSDGGRDGYFQGAAPYPSAVNRWRGTWYIQSKFHAPHLSADPQKWLLEQIGAELRAFGLPDTKREWPDNWIVATNIDPSGAPMTGSFDRAVELVRRARPSLSRRFHIWGGSKIIDLISQTPGVATRYAHLITAGHIL